MGKIFSFFQNNKTLSFDLHDLLSNKAVVNGTNTIASYFKKHNITYNENELVKLRSMLETELFEQSKAFCVRQYYLCKRVNDWWNVSEYQAKVAMCRNFLNISPKININENHLDSFEKKLRELEKEYGLSEESLETLKSKLVNFKFHFINSVYSLNKIDYINKVLVFLESNKKIILTSNGGYVFLYYVEYSIKSLDNVDVGFIEKELMRSPISIMALAAISFERNTYIRREVLRTIFYQKWIPHFYIMENEPWSIQYSSERNISEGIKRYVFQLYRVSDEEELESKRIEFIKNMSETIVYHELGHVIINQDILDISIGSILESTQYYGETIFISLLEILADLAPKNGKVQGAIFNMARVAKHDEERATKMFYMYISDVWFYDTEDEYMYPYANLILLILIQYINDDMTINFGQIREDLSESALNKPNTLLSFLTVYCAEASLELKRLIESATYEIGNTPAEYKNIKKFVNSKFEENGDVVDLTSYTYNASFWRTMIDYNHRFSITPNAVKEFIDSKNRELQQELFKRIAGVELAGSYNYNIQNYIVDKFESMNLKAFE